MSRTATRRHNAWPEKPPAHRDEPRDARDDEWAALLEESRASDPRLADRPAPRVERFTYGVDGADDRTATFYGAAFTAADATPRPGVVLFHTAAGPRDRFVEWMAERLVAAAVEDRHLERGPAEWLASGLRDPRVLPAVLEGALESKRRGKGDVVSVSRNVFIPLTNLCRDRCAYCTFAVQPDSPEAKTYSLDEVAEAVRDVGGRGARGESPETTPREN